MKNTLLKWTLLPGLLVGPLAPAAWAQCVTTPLPAGCGANQVFQAYVGTTAVQSLCVGQTVTLVPGCGRTVKANLLYYNAQPTPNLATTTINCAAFGGASPNSTYTPTAAGYVTLTELANPDASVGQTTATLFARNFQVFDNPAPTFTLAPCLGGTASVTVAAGAGYDQYAVQVSGTTVATVAPGATAVVPAPGGSTVTVQGIHSNNPLCVGQSSQPVPALAAPVAPTLTRLTTGGPLPGTLTLDLAGLQAGFIYEVQRADASAPGGFQVVATAPAGTTGATTLTLAGAAAGQYRLRQRDACQNVPNATAPVPTLVLTGTSLSNVNTLSWQAGGPVTGYTLLRDGTTLAALPPTATTYSDAAVVCGTRYTYRLTATVAGGSQAVSNEVTVQTISALAPPPPLLNATFDLRNRVNLTATLPGGAALPAGSTVAYSRQGGGAAITYIPVPAPSPALLRDSTALADLLASPPCYTAAVQDICGNRSATNPPTCPVLLTVEAADPDGRTARLTWTAFRGPGSPGQVAGYRVLTLAADGTVLFTSAPTTSLTYFDGSPPTDRQILRYRVEASGAGLPAGTVSYSNVATLTRRPLLAVPNAFTPNGDGLNDVLEVKGRYLTAFIFVVVDRNGQEVFRATDRSQTWDGTIQGHAPVNAAYVWRFSMLDEAGQLFSQTGSVSILK